MTSVELPVRLGPDSQPEMEGDRLDFLPMPRQMSCFRAPLVEDEDAWHLRTAGLNRLARLQSLVNAAARDLTPARLALDNLAASDLELIDYVLGEGEVCATVDGSPRLRIQESIFAGVWRVQALDEEGAPMEAWLEVGAVPAAVNATPSGSGTQRPSAPAEPPEGVANGAAVWTELRQRSQACEHTGAEHIVNLTLLPLSPEDHAYLRDQLAGGRITILSRGYGNCRITATALPHVWWVQYFNSMDTLILNTLEVTRVPAVACAAADDLADSARRLREIRETLQ